MKKRIMSFVIALVLLATSSTVATAVELRSSPTLAIYSAMITKGKTAGKIIISYDVNANTEAEEVGVSSIEIYKAANDSYVTTITGSTRNGLITTDSVRHRSSYTYSGTSGVEYYAIVTVYAKINGVSDSKEYTTNSCKAP